MPAEVPIVTEYPVKLELYVGDLCNNLGLVLACLPSGNITSHCIT